MKRHSQSGVALVITLIMLSVITLLAVAFLAISRRNKESVGTSQDQAIARDMAEAARARAQAEVMARMMSTVQGTNIVTNVLNFELTVSTNYINQAGFIGGTIAEDPANVNYEHYSNSTAPLFGDDIVRNIGNLARDPRPPVFVKTRNGLEFRYFLDLNRNGFPDTNGLAPVINPNGGFYDTNGVEIPNIIPGNTMSNFFVGDPEWIGILEKPDQPHSGTNRFIGRYCYIIVPVGKSLDLNFIHNQAKRLLPDQDGYLRNQGYGSWELNLAAFLADLNTNYWNTNAPVNAPYHYDTNANVSGVGGFASSTGWAFDDANELLRYRYSPTRVSSAGNYNTLLAAQSYYQTSPNDFLLDGIDNYSDGPLMMSNFFTEVALNQDKINLPWSGSDNTNSFYTLHDELFDAGKIVPKAGDLVGFVGRLTAASQQTNSYDRYTFYRLLSQMAVDSAPERNNKININYKDQANFVPWTNNPVEFFTNTAVKLIGAYYEAPVTNINIQIYSANINTPTNYPLEIHRLLQTAANIYDATMTNDYPTVFRPVFDRHANGDVFIVNYVQQLDTNFWTNPWHAVTDPALGANDNVYGVPLIIGARMFNYTDPVTSQIKKIGYPTFNELSVQTMAAVTRRVEVRKDVLNGPPTETNLLYTLSLSNMIGVEAWNSYTNPFPKPLTLMISNEFIFTITNENGPIGSYTNVPMSITTNFPIFTWSGASSVPLSPNNIRMVLSNMVGIFTNSQYYVGSDTFIPTIYPPLLSSYEQNDSLGNYFYYRRWGIIATNRMQYMLVSDGHVVDVINSGDIPYSFDFTGYLQDHGVIDPYWDTNRIAGGQSLQEPTKGIYNQLRLSQQYTTVGTGDWKSYGNLKTTEKEAAYFFKFLNPKVTLAKYPTMSDTNTAAQAPFTPSWFAFQARSWEVNDPFVRYPMAVLNLRKTNEMLLSEQVTSNLWFQTPTWGKLNESYSPWGGKHEPMTIVTTPSSAPPGYPDPYDMTVKDAQVGRADDWDFPSGLFPSIGWLGRVHRGTPWQTIYLKADPTDPSKWTNWAQNIFTQPTNDWRLMDVFTTAPNDNASRGLLSVNQTNLAAWSAALSGVLVLSNATTDDFLNKGNAPNFVPYTIEPGSPQLQAIWSAIVQTNRINNGFAHMGDFLSVPQLTTLSPYLTNNVSPQTLDVQRRLGISDMAYERIPQQIMSLLKMGDPRFVIYTWGQSLKPAENSIVFNPPSDRPELQNICTNYQITGEVATRLVMHLEQRGTTNKTYQGVVDSYNILPGE